MKQLCKKLNCLKILILITPLFYMIYLTQNSAESVIIFGTSLSNEEERIFYGLSTSGEKYIFKDNNEQSFPFIKKNINRAENKKILNPKIGLFELGRNNIFIILIGTDDSYIEIFNIKYYNEFNSYTASDFFPYNIINKGISPLIYCNMDNLIFISSSIYNNDTTNFFISANKYEISIEDNYIFNYELNYNNTFSNIKGEHIDCFTYSMSSYSLSPFYSCIYLDIDNNYKINIIEDTDSNFIERNSTIIGSISNPVEGEIYFFKGIRVAENNLYAIYVYYSGNSNNIPTFLFTTIDKDNNFAFSNKYNDQFPVVYLYDYPFNNGMKYNDLVLNQFDSTYDDFYFVSTNTDKEYLIIAYIIIFTSSSSPDVKKLSIRYYTIQLKNYFNMNIFHGFKIINFNLNYLSIAFDFCLNDQCGSSNNGNAALMIFSYINKTQDININFTEYAFNNNKIYIITNLTESFSISNNIFGYKFGGAFELYDLDYYYEEEEKGIGFYYGIDDEPISDSYLPIEEAIKIDFSDYNFDEPLYDEILFHFFAYIFPEENLDVFNSYCDNYNDSFGDINDDNSYHLNFKGSINAKYYINLEDELTKICNATNCDLCLRNDPYYCILCIDDNYTIIYDDIYGKRKICEIESETTIIDTTIIDIDSTQSSNGINLNNLLNSKYKDINLSNEEIKKVYGELQSYLKEKYKGENTIISTNNVKMQISKIDEQKNNQELSNIDLGECEEKLKSKYCKSEEDSLIILKFDITPEYEKSTFVGYEVYDPYTLSKIDLNDECKQSNIIMNVPIQLDSKIEELYDLLSKSGYNLFSDKNEFYNDICATYTTENGTDILLYDRRMDIYQLTVNISLCQEGCEFGSYDKNTKKAKCNCPLNQNTNEINNLDLSNIKFDKNEMLDRFKEVIDNSNFRVLKCYKLLLKFNLFIKNIGSIIMTILFILFLILLIIYKLVSSKKIHFYIQNIIKYKNENARKISTDRNLIEENNNKKIKRNHKKRKSKKKKSNKSLKNEEIINYNNNNKDNIMNNEDSKKAPPKKTIKYISQNNLEGLTNSKNIIILK